MLYDFVSFASFVDVLYWDDEQYCSLYVMYLGAQLLFTILMTHYDDLSQANYNKNAPWTCS